MTAPWTARCSPNAAGVVAPTPRPGGRPSARGPGAPATVGVSRPTPSILHLWQAIQVVIDLAVSSCVRLGLGSPPTYADAFRLLADAGVIPGELADRLVRAAGFRNLLVHAYGSLDLRRVYAIAEAGPADLRAFLAALRDHADGWPRA